MKCHYEVLGVDSNCTLDDLKKAYRKLALEWHPDKNLDRLDEANENFLLIQQAYEILSDPQERAWYDRHKDDILRGGAEQEYKDDCLDVYQYFNTSCFKGYNDDEKGFYTVYRQVFEKITAEDKPFMDDDEDMEIPQFGDSTSSYEEVVHNFYAYWQSYCTAKSFSWVDKFDLTEARKMGVGRYNIRVMEKENKKLRDQSKKQRNEEVRELVAFVRKRDKRVQAAKKRMEEAKAEKAKKAEENRRKQLQERNKSLETYTEAEWSSMSQFENHFDEIESALDATFGNKDGEGDLNENGDLDESGDLYCVACEKDFRSEKAFKNHENSKKHKENVIMLKTVMEEEEAMATSEVTEQKDENSADADDENTSSKDLLDELIKSSTKSKSKKKKKKNKTSAIDNEQSVAENLAEVELQMENVHIADAADSEEIQNVTDVTSDVVDDTSSVLDGNNENSKAKQENTHKLTAKSEPSKKKGKKDKGQKSESAVKEPDEVNEKPCTSCSVCNNDFSSRNKLFEHIKETGHAVYKNEPSVSGRSGKKQKKKKL